jgi:hypothetical protein
MKLYRSIKYSARWFAFSPDTGWVMFPAEVGGWEKREPARGIDPLDVREVPLRFGFNTGINSGAAKSENPKAKLREAA